MLTSVVKWVVYVRPGLYYDLLSKNVTFKSEVQWDQSSPGNSASHYSHQSLIKLDFSAAWVVLDFSKEVPKYFFSWNLNFVWKKSIKTAVARSLFIGSIRCIKYNVFKNVFYTFHISWPELIRATVSKIRQILRFYTNDAKKDTIIDNNEKFQLIQVIKYEMCKKHF